MTGAVVCGIFIPERVVAGKWRSSETSAIRTQTPGNYPKESIIHDIFLSGKESGFFTL